MPIGCGPTFSSFNLPLPRAYSSERLAYRLRIKQCARMVRRQLAELHVQNFATSGAPELYPRALARTVLHRSEAKNTILDVARKQSRDRGDMMQKEKKIARVPFYILQSLRAIACLLLLFRYVATVQFTHVCRVAAGSKVRAPFFLAVNCEFAFFAGTVDISCGMARIPLRAFRRPFSCPNRLQGSTPRRSGGFCRHGCTSAHCMRCR